ncbi:MAG TPA: hypothetical protein PKJ83_18510, partial [Cyclobacteriaceae bacterium]|nr:hypothetical protein [Cyclobacteriaceae bacterium]
TNPISLNTTVLLVGDLEHMLAQNTTGGVSRSFKLNYENEFLLLRCTKIGMHTKWSSISGVTP